MSEETKRQMTEEELGYEMRPECHFSKAMMNPYPARARATGGGIVTIEPELFAKFPIHEAVNEALRSFVKQREQDAA